MECNKDEALRAKEIAEGKFGAGDVSGAKKFALKAQNLYPELVGIARMLSTLEVYISAENKINGEIDWYGVLGVDSRSDVETMRKQYRKMALALHPDKNSFVGADGAFKLILKAWKLLSDEDTRVAYDLKRNTKSYPKGASTTVRRSSAPSGANRRRNSTTSSSNCTTSKPKTQKCSAGADPLSASAPACKPITIQTECYHCKMQHEVPLTYRYQIINCPSCHKPFLVRESATPAADSETSTSGKFSQQKTSNNQGASKNTVGRNGKVPSVARATKFKSHDSRAYTFRTLCIRCKTHHKFLRVYANRNILCPTCRTPFLAREQETSPPTNGSEAFTSDSSSQAENLDNQRMGKKT